MTENQSEKKRPSLVSINDNGDVELNLNKSWFPKAESSMKTIAAFVAVIAAIASWLKPQDNTVTKASYDTLSKEVKQISDQTIKNHDDLIATKAYLDGFTNRIINEPIEIPTINEQSLAEAVRESLVRQRLPIKYIRKAVHDTISNPPPIPSISASPPISPRPEPVKTPDFKSIIEKAKKWSMT